MSPLQCWKNTLAISISAEIVMAYDSMAYTLMAYIVMAEVGMACIVMV